MSAKTLAERVRPHHRPLPCHVWIDGQPGVLLEWRRDSTSWWGRVLHAEDGVGAESWVRSEHIRPCP